MNIKVILNPISGGGRGGRIWRRLEQELSRMQPKGIVWACSRTEGPEQTRKMAREAKGQGFDAVLVIGGDGTVGDAAWGSMGDKIPLLIVPAGTGNASARSLGLKASCRSVINTLIDGRTMDIDAGMINSSLFLNMAGIGFDADVLDQYRKRTWTRGIPGYMAVGLSMLPRYRPAHITLSEGDKSQSFEAVMVAVCNGSYYGGGLQMAPQAKMDDGLLDFCILKDLKPREYLSIWHDLYRGHHLRHPKISILQAESLTFESRDKLMYHRDGELAGATPCHIKVLPQAIRVMIPEGGKQK